MIFLRKKSNKKAQGGKSLRNLKTFGVKLCVEEAII